MMNVGNGDHAVENNQNAWPFKLSTEGVRSKSSTRVMRKFINSAIYVEKPVSSTASSENTSVSYKLSHEDLFENKTKRCTCSLDQKTCPCHCDSAFTFIPNETKRNAVAVKISKNTSKISPNFKFAVSIEDEKEQILKKWKTKKLEEKRSKEHEVKMANDAKKKDKEKLLEEERNNFKKWLMNKKKIELEAKKKKEKELEEQQIKELEKEKRQLENELNFQLWLRKKEEVGLEKKIKKQMEVIGDLERKERQLRENQKAFNDWLKNSKNKQKPIPLNKGLESLRSSTSVTYVNPNPWNPIS